MAKNKPNFCFIFVKCFLLYFLFCFVAGSDSTSPNLNPNQNNQNKNDAEDPKLSLVLRLLETLENKHKKLEKSYAELKSRFKTLEKEVAELKSENCVGEDVWLLTPPLRGRRGQKGEKGDCGILQPKSGGAPGENGEKDQCQSPTEQKGDSEIPAPPSKSITSCSVAMEILPPPLSKKQTIYPHGNRTSLEVLCDFETNGGGWTIIQKRSSGPRQEFHRNWTDYARGFGSLDKNFWLGLDNIHALTQNGDQELRIDLADFEGNTGYAKYSNFSVSSASDFYRLSIGGYSSDEGHDMMNPSDPKEMLNGNRFSTKDKDHDKAPSFNCAAFHESGWWFNWCARTNLNGHYREKGGNFPVDLGIKWPSWRGPAYSLAKTEMKIRKRR